MEEYRSMQNNVIKVELINGELVTREYSDFYIQDKIVTVYRDEKIKIDNSTYYPFKLHIPVTNMMSIEEIKK